MSIALGAVKINSNSAVGAINIGEICINTSISLMYMLGGAGSFNMGDILPHREQPFTTTS